MAPSFPVGLRWRSHSAFILATVAIGQFTDILLYSMVIPILPFLLHDRIGLDGNDLQIHISGLLATFSAASLVFSIPAGLLADATKTRQAPYLLGLILLIISTIMFAVAKNFISLIVARIFQGASAAIVNAVGLAMVVDTVGSERLGVALGTVSPSPVSYGRAVVL
jgi:MFS family permease